MPDIKVSDLFKIGNRYLRSTHLERDFNDPSALNDYIISDFSLDCLKRLTKGINANSSQRAWRITGDYGSGKSSFALFLAHWFNGEIGDLPQPIKKKIDFKAIINKDNLNFIPILVTGSRLPLRFALLKSLYNCLNSLQKRGAKLKIFNELERALNSEETITDDQVLNYIIDANKHITSSNKGTGLLIIIDELGKFLEYAAQHPEQQDVFLLQKLAEVASRSGKEPLFIIGILHQGFSSYADQLSHAGQREWEKVAARFDEVIFNQPIEQMASLISSALKVKSSKLTESHIKNINKEMETAIKLGWFGVAPAEKKLKENAKNLFPLHPSVVPVLIRIFNRFGQNERSLFSFLLSNEPFGLQEFAEKNFIRNDTFYQLHDLYDYVRFNFGYQLSAQNYRSHWNHIQSMIDSFATNSELELNILKTVGIINLINQNDLLATSKTVALSLNNSKYNSDDISNALEILHKKRHVLYHRGAAGGYCLWPHTSVDLDQAVEKAKKAISTSKSITRVIEDHIDPTPLVARRHYIQTGNLRHFDVFYCSVFDLSAIVKNIKGDNAIIIPLCETKAERSKALSFIKQATELHLKPNILIAVPPYLNVLSGLVYEAQKWQWVFRNISELAGDRFARSEVERQIDFTRSTLLKQINTFIGLRQFTGQMDLEWYQQGQLLNISTGRELLSKLSELCDNLYTEAPIIKNELINRSSLSSAAAAARMRLIERMINDPDKPFLGMDPNKKPPEMSAYLSILKQSNLHQLKDGIWSICLPIKEQDKCNFLPVFDKIKSILKDNNDNRVSVNHIILELQKPPYGLREGIIPILLAAYKIIFEHEIAFYENGTFARVMAGEEFLRLIKAPETFELQYCKIEGLRTDIFHKLTAALGLTDSKAHEPELLDIVQPLCVFVANLPLYVHNTKLLSKEALKVREAILSAQEPIKLLFYNLPKACGLEEFKTDTEFNADAVNKFVGILKDSINELKMSYQSFNERLKKQILDAFISSESLKMFRKNISDRAEIIAIKISEPKLKAFCLRLMDESLPEHEWVESIASYLVSKPPDKWKDDDEIQFNQRLIEYVSRFFRIESVLFSEEGNISNSIGMRLSLTRSDGNEKENVFYLGESESYKAEELQKEISMIIKKHKQIGFAAAFKALWENIPKDNKEVE